MIQTVKDLQGDEIIARDGPIGSGGCRAGGC